MGSTVREQRVAEIRRLRDDEGLLLREIAERLGIAISTVQDYYTDPDGSKARARKAKNHGVCIDCGAETRNSGSAKYVPERCRACFDARPKKYWTRERIIEAICEWVAEYGEPPTAMQWSPSQARRAGLGWMAERWESGEWPVLTTVQKAFGSWNAGIAAAGFTPRGIGVRGGGWYRPEQAAA